MTLVAAEHSVAVLDTYEPPSGLKPEDPWEGHRTPFESRLSANTCSKGEVVGVSTPWEGE